MAEQQAKRAELAAQLVSDLYAPAVALVTTNFECLHISGPIERYFDPELLKLSSDVVAAAQAGLRDKLRQALHEAICNYRRVVVFQDQPGSSHPFSIDVRPTAIEGKKLFLVCLAGDYHPALPSLPVGRSLGIDDGESIIARDHTVSRSESDFRNTDEIIEGLPAEIDHSDIVLILEDDPNTSGFLQLVLKTEGHTVAIAHDAMAMFEMMVRGSMQPDLILADYGLLPRGEQLGSSSTRDVLRRIPTIALISDTNSDAPDILRFEKLVLLNKPVRAAELTNAVHRLLNQHSVPAGQAGLQQLIETRKFGLNLTERQRQILQRVLAGNPSKNIAADLGISRRTVENHRASIMRKTGAKSIADLARIALATARRDRV